jgi:hypothetical protein
MVLPFAAFQWDEAQKASLSLSRALLAKVREFLIDLCLSLSSFFSSQRNSLPPFRDVLEAMVACLQRDASAAA